MFNGFSHSVMGASHVAKGIVCQDSSAHKITDRYAVAVVADGHGSKKHFRSNIGSQCAVEATIETIERFYEDADDFEKNFPKNHKRILRNIERQIVAVWNSKVMKHLEENPVTVVEKKPFKQEEFEAISPESYYGTTLIAAVAGKGFSFGVQIGDGSMVGIFEDGEAIMPMDYEEANPANITASICNTNAASMFESFYIDDKRMIALYTSTDGLYTSFGSEYDFRDYHVIVSSQLQNAEALEASVVKNITKRSHFGTEDDISFACVYDPEFAAEKAGLLADMVERNKKLAAERKAKLHTANF